MAKIVTANTLAAGHVVFLAANGGWVETLALAAPYDDNAAADHALAAAPRGDVVDPFVTERGPETDGRPAMTLRDTIRAFGPTIAYLPQAVGQE